MSGGEFTSPPRKTRAGDAGDAKSSEARQASTPRVRCDAPASHLIAEGGLGGAPLAPPSSMRSGAGFTPLGAAKRIRLMSGGEFTSPPRKTRAGDAGDAKSSEARQASTPRVRCGAPASHLVARGGLGG